MNSRQRLLAAIRHQQPDRLPISPLILQQYLPKLYKCSVFELTWEHQLKAAVNFGYDAIINGGGTWRVYSLKRVSKRIEQKMGNITRIIRTFDTPAGILREVMGIPNDPYIREHSPDRTAWIKEHSG